MPRQVLNPAQWLRVRETRDSHLARERSQAEARYANDILAQVPDVSRAEALRVARRAVLRDST